MKRRLRNCHPDVPKSEVAEVLSKFSQKMKNSGYNQRFREQVLKSYGSDNTTRKTNEAVRINLNTGVRLNSKAEYRQPTVPRLAILRSSNE